MSNGKPTHLDALVGKTKKEAREKLSKNGSYHSELAIIDEAIEIAKSYKELAQQPHQVQAVEKFKETVKNDMLQQGNHFPSELNIIEEAIDYLNEEAETLARESNECAVRQIEIVELRKELEKQFLEAKGQQLPDTRSENISKTDNITKYEWIINELMIQRLGVLPLQPQQPQQPQPVEELKKRVKQRMLPTSNKAPSELDVIEEAIDSLCEEAESLDRQGNKSPERQIEIVKLKNELEKQLLKAKAQRDKAKPIVKKQARVVKRGQGKSNKLAKQISRDPSTSAQTEQKSDQDSRKTPTRALTREKLSEKVSILSQDLLKEAAKRIGMDIKSESAKNPGKDQNSRKGPK